MQELFFELIRVAIGWSGDLSRIPSAEEWTVLYSMAKKQAVVGICFAGVKRLDKQGMLVNMPMQVRMEWLAMSAQIQAQNEIVNQRCLEVQEILAKAGMRSVILKGQGVAKAYSLPLPEGKGENLGLLRQSGDIDVWVDASREKVIRYAVGVKPTGAFDEKHVHFDCFEDVPVELHWVPVRKWNPRWNRLLNAYFNKERERQMDAKGEMVNFPNLDFQLTHQLLHVMGHFIESGVGMRQMMDLYFTQQACMKEMPERIDEVLSLFKKMGLMDLVAATQWVIQKVFGIKDAGSLLCVPNEREGRSLLDEIMAGGNFGQYVERNGELRKTLVGKFWHKWMRLIRFVRFDTLGALVMPIARLKLEVWMRYERMKLKV